MAGLIFLEEELVLALEGALAALDGTGFTLKLFQNNYTPVDGSTAANFTEATFTGYASQAITMGTPTLVGQYAISNSVTYTFTAGAIGTANTIYGYYVVDNTTSLVSWAERFAAPYSMSVTGASLAIILQLTCSSQNH